MRDLKLAALRLAQEATKQDPKEIYYQDTLGLVPHRAWVGIEEAIARSELNARAQGIGEIKQHTDWAFLAMSHCALGRMESALHIALHFRHCSRLPKLPPSLREEWDAFRAYADAALPKNILCENLYSILDYPIAYSATCSRL